MAANERVQWPYRRIAGSLRERITTGQISGQLPSRMKLAEEYGVSHMTMHRALEVLKDEGLIYSVPGLGVFTEG